MTAPSVGSQARSGFPPLEAALVDRLLAHIGVRLDGRPPSPEGLTTLHHALLDRVPYENLEIQLGRPTTIDPAESVRRILTGRGGYCYHLNGMLGALLGSLGYDAVPVRAAAPSAGDGSAWGNHLVVLVRFPAGPWLADVGLGDGFRDPVPLVVGVLRQAPFTYRLDHVDGTRWRFHHDPMASIAGFDLDVPPVELSSFAPLHERLSTSPDSSFVQRLVVQMRRHDHALTLRGCVLTQASALGRAGKDVLDEREWYAVLADEFGLRLPDVGAEARHQLWRRVRTAHDAWDRAGRP